METASRRVCPEPARAGPAPVRAAHPGSPAAAHAESVADPADDVGRWSVRRAWTLSTTGWRLAAAGTALVATLGALLGWWPPTVAVAVVAVIPAVLVDAAVSRLPTRLVWGAGAVVGVALVVAVVGGIASPIGGLSSIATGAALFALPLLAMHLVSPASMGFGDVRLAVVLGAALSTVDPAASLVALTVASALAATVGLARRMRAVPFGPAMTVATLVAAITVGEIR